MPLLPFHLSQEYSLYSDHSLQCPKIMKNIASRRKNSNELSRIEEHTSSVLLLKIFFWGEIIFLPTENKFIICE